MRINRKGWPYRKEALGSSVSVPWKVAVDRARVEYEIMDRARYDGRAAALAELRGGRVVADVVRCASAGEVFGSFLRVMTKDSNRRAVQSTRLLVALAKGWVVREEGGSRAESIREGSELARRIDGLPGDEVWCVEGLRAYFAARQGGAYDPQGRAREHLAFNKTVRFARELWTRRARALCYEGLTLPPELERWLVHPLLQEVAVDPREGAILPDDFVRMVEEARGLMGSGDERERAMGLANWCLRTLGLRTKELLYMRGGWLWQEPRSGRWYVDVKPRPEEGFTIKGKEAGQVPVHGDLLAVLRGVPAGEFVLLPGALPTPRARLLEREHNGWVKGIIGETHRGDGNHRLRKMVASFLADRHGDQVAATYLRHADAGKEAKTARAHYIARKFEGLPTVCDEDLLGWVRGC